MLFDQIVFFWIEFWYVCCEYWEDVVFFDGVMGGQLVGEGEVGGEELVEGYVGGVFVGCVGVVEEVLGLVEVVVLFVCVSVYFFCRIGYFRSEEEFMKRFILLVMWLKVWKFLFDSGGSFFLFLVLVEVLVVVGLLFVEVIVVFEENDFMKKRFVSL